MNFLRYLIINGVQRWGSFMWVGTHVSMTQTDWHWMLETILCVGLDIILVMGLYLEWVEYKKNINNEKAIK
jgi:hypothetical protein